MRVYTPSEKSMRETEEACCAVPDPDRVTASGKRVWYTGRGKDQGAGLYFVGAMGADLVKIGWVRNLEKMDDRIYRMQIDCPFPVMTLLTVGPATRVHESRIHKRFIDVHFHGEWFRYAGALREVLDVAAQDVEVARATVRAAFTGRLDGS